MQAAINRETIHHFKVDDGQGGQKDILQFDVEFPEHPEFGPYSLQIDFPVTKDTVKNAVRTKAQEVESQLAEAQTQRQSDNEVRGQLGLGGNVLEFDTEV